MTKSPPTRPPLVLQRCSIGNRFEIALLLTLVALCGSPAPAQQANARTPAAKEEEEDKKPPAPEPFYVKTKDNWKVHCLYFAPVEGITPGKQTVPIILIHNWEGQASDFGMLPVGLQTYGHAVVAVDLRGHGRSTTRELPNGDDETVKYDDMNKFDMANVYLDIEAVKKWLMEKNNAGDLNIEMLTVVGAEVGSLVALNWAAADWSWPQTPAYKQGQDVKAIVLLSPSERYKGLSATSAIAHPAIAKKLAVMICVGNQDRRAVSDAKRIYGRLERTRPPLPKERAERLEKQDLFLIEAPTELQGTKLLARELPINANIVGFINVRLRRHAEDFIWTDRKSPIGN